MKPGSVLITTTKHDKGILGLASKLIRWGERLIWKKARFTHCAIVAYEETIIEATVGGVQRSPTHKYIGKGHITKILTPSWLTDEKGDVIILEAEAYIDLPYGYVDLLIYLVDIGVSKIIRRQGL